MKKVVTIKSKKKFHINKKKGSIKNGTWNNKINLINKKTFEVKTKCLKHHQKNYMK